MSVIREFSEPVGRGPTAIPAGLVEVRPAWQGEAAALSDVALRSKARWGYGAAFLSACVRELTLTEDDIAHDSVWVSVDLEGIPVGFAHAVRADGVLELLKFFIAPEGMGCGRGKRLWQVVERHARAQGLGEIVLDAEPYAVGFYRRMGLVIAGESPSGSIPGRVLPRMVKQLAV